ncbi:MAG: pyrimidine 5'-nucleotidase [Spirochaetales bacterium]|jgi:putative hydrolase of the HAD superfamily|nr:pyrimidine 5'-nucleotidase [Spirochaetales bacterium]
MIECILFDLDNTLYPKSSGLDKEVNRRMTEFTAGCLGISREEAQRRRETEAIPYGTTLKWLTGTHNLSDPEGFLEAVHPPNLEDYFAPDPPLREMLRGLPHHRAILTNSPAEHAQRVLRRLGIEDQFSRIFDIRYNGFQGKPSPLTYTKVLQDLGFEAAQVLFIDDMPRYLFPFRGLGGRALLVDEAGTCAQAGLPVIRKITELKDYLQTLGEMR